jgi:hypothetical protein
MPIRDVAAAAHMTALEVLDAADALTYHRAAAADMQRSMR